MTQLTEQLRALTGTQYRRMGAAILLILCGPAIAIASPIIRHGSATITVAQTVSSNEAKNLGKNSDQKPNSTVQVSKTVSVRNCETPTVNINKIERKLICQLNLIETF